MIYSVLTAQKELNFDSEFLTKKTSLVTYKLVEKAKPNGEKFGVTTTNHDIATSAQAYKNSRPTLALLTQEVQELKA